MKINKVCFVKPMASSGAKSRLTVVRGVITKFYHGVESRALECSLEKINEFKSTCEEYNSLVEERIDSLVSMDGTEEEIKRIESYVVKIKTVWDFFDSKVKMDNNACRNMPKIIIKFDGRKSNWLSFRDLFVTRYLANSQLSETEKFQLLRQAMPVYLHSFFNVNPTLKNIEWILSNLDDRYVSPDDSINEIFRDFKKIKPAFVNNDLRRLADELMVWFRRASDAEADSSRVEQEFLDNFFSLLPNGWAMPMKDYVSTLDLEGFELIEDILDRLSKRIKEFWSIQFNRPGRSNFNGFKKQSFNVPNLRPSNVICLFCNKNHAPAVCNVGSVQSRKQKLISLRRCLICFQIGHIAKACKSNVKCGGCGGRHHKSLCAQNSSIVRSRKINVCVCVCVL